MTGECVAMADTNYKAQYREGLSNAGLRITRPRLRILEILEHAADRGEHLSAEDVYRELLGDAEPDAGIATVYRVLAQFEVAGLVNRLNFDGGQAVFELERGTHHDHMVCLDSGEVVEFCEEQIEALQEKIARKHGYQLVDHSLVLYVRPLGTSKTSKPPRTPRKKTGTTRRR